jgi:aspartate dehydrogenase
MKRPSGKLRLGIVGCGAIGSRIAASVRKELAPRFSLSALYDIEPSRARLLSERLRSPGIVKTSFQALLGSSDLVVECVNTPACIDIVRSSLISGKTVLAMSVGRVLHSPSVLSLAGKNRASLLLPSGAVAGLDAVKAAALAGISSALLVTRKSPSGFSGNQYLIDKGIDLSGLKRERVIFYGKASDAVRHFPQNINVAAALKLALGDKATLRVKIVAVPSLRRNVHEIVLEGDFGRLTARTENAVCPDNPRTSYLAVLSSIQALKQFSSQVRIGT